jgi:hypothetical protein
MTNKDIEKEVIRLNHEAEGFEFLASGLKLEHQAESRSRLLAQADVLRLLAKSYNEHKTQPMDPLLKAKQLIRIFAIALKTTVHNSGAKKCAMQSVYIIIEHKELIQDEDYTVGDPYEWENYKSYWDQVLFCMSKL